MYTREEYLEAKRQLRLAQAHRDPDFEGCDCGWAATCNCIYGEIVRDYKEQEDVSHRDFRNELDTLR